MAHNRDEEIEHTALTIEWLRHTMDSWDEELRTDLFTTESFTFAVMEEKAIVVCT